MIPKDTVTVYAQYNEDVIIAALLHDTENGFYVDVGANHEEFHSVTKYFYERGWRGINIEPIPRLIKEISRKRPRDINLGYAVSTKKGKMKFREYPKHDGLSTFSEQSKLENEKRRLPYKDYDIKVNSLKNILNDYKVDTIDFLKIDVEGFEEEVLKSNDWIKFRPRVLCVEANHRKQDWSKYLENKDYRKVIFDGLNEYYIAKECIKLLDKFADTVTIMSHNALRNHHFVHWKADLKHMDELRDMTQRQNKYIESVELKNYRLNSNLKSEKFLLKQLVDQLLRRTGIRK